MSAGPAELGWAGVVRLGLAQTALGAAVVLATNVFNRVMIVEWALPAILASALIAWHYAVQITRPRWGHSADVSTRRAVWIVGGVGVLGLGVVLAAFATGVMGRAPAVGVALSVLGFGVIGLGVGAGGTALLSLIAARTPARRRGAAASIVWIMMIVDMAVTAKTAGGFLDPFSPERLLAVSAVVAAAATLLAALAVSPELFGPSGLAPPAVAAAPKPPFRFALASVWADATARRFTIFVFVSMVAYSMQDPILEPYAAFVFGMSVGESTAVGGNLHAGAALGMIVVALASALFPRRRIGSLRGWTVGGCVGSGVALASLAVIGGLGAAGEAAFKLNVLLLGFANGAFAVGAIGAMMAIAKDGAVGREGVRMGVFGAAQAVGFGLGQLTGGGAVDIAVLLTGDRVVGYAGVFAVEAALFAFAATLAFRAAGPAPVPAPKDGGLGYA
ncbi:MAG: BCD family MFS transporter [Pseudomonadota bacterium]